MKRWRCPKCGGVRLAPSAPRADDVRRFCLPCSEKGGRLVERVCVVREAAQARAAAEREEAREANARAREEAREARAAEERDRRPLSVDELSETLSVPAAWAMTWVVARERGPWAGAVLRVPVTLVSFSDGGRSAVFRREDTGREVRAAVRPSERICWVRHFVQIEGWGIRQNVLIQLANEAPEARGAKNV